MADSDIEKDVSCCCQMITNYARTAIYALNSLVNAKGEQAKKRHGKQRDMLGLRFIIITNYCGWKTDFSVLQTFQL